MTTLSIDLENCFGISKLKHEFDFTKFGTHLIYASNGVMKTSFANTFQALQRGESPKDRIHGKPSTYNIQIDGSPISGDTICVVKSFDSITTTDSQSRLLVDPTSKSEYDSIYRDIRDKKQRLIIDLNRLSGVKKEDIEGILLSDFGASDLFELLRDETKDYLGIDYKHLKYPEIFNSDVVDFLSKPHVKEGIQEYTVEYKRLLDESPIFSKGIFNPSKAEVVINALKSSNFFQAGHTVKLKGEDDEYDDSEKLRNRLLEERKVILENPKLLAIEQHINKAAVVKFQEKLEKEHFLAELSDVVQFKKNVWKSYLIDKQMIIDDLLATFDAGKKRLSEIEELASSQSTAWDEVIETFNKRFFVPFEASVSNKQGTVLGRSMPVITFKFVDEETGESAEFTESEIDKRDVLSQGEKRAMYLMNIIFMLEDHRKSGESKLYIIDDIADSFDYKNKYAIIQYLEEISDSADSRQIILTHNFDFFRTIQSRILGGNRWTNSFIADKIEGEIVLTPNGTKSHVNPFEDWIANLDNAECLLATLPFVRNLIEFKGPSFEDKFTLLTSVLHEKPTSSSVTVNDIRPIFQDTLSNNCDTWGGAERIVDLFEHSWQTIMDEPIEPAMDLRKKVILSIGIRVKAERYILSKVADKTIPTKNQTAKLFKRFKTQFQTTHSKELKVLDRVNLITPENIHLNSFMFEPILDLSMDHLKRLYSDIVGLN